MDVPFEQFHPSRDYPDASFPFLTIPREEPEQERVLCRTAIALASYPPPISFDQLAALDGVEATGLVTALGLPLVLHGQVATHGHGFGFANDGFFHSVTSPSVHLLAMLMGHDHETATSMLVIDFYRRVNAAPDLVGLDTTVPDGDGRISALIVRVSSGCQGRWIGVTGSRDGQLDCVVLHGERAGHRYREDVGSRGQMVVLDETVDVPDGPVDFARFGRQTGVLPIAA